MRAVILVFSLSVTSQAMAGCGKLCDGEWWKTATTADLQAELDAGANVMARTNDGATPLHYASQQGTGETIKALLAAGADITARHECGSTPLHSAAANGTTETIKVLLAGGADVMAEEADGWTPLHRTASCFSCEPENIQILLAAGASVTATDEDGKTPLDYAEENGHIKETKGYLALKAAQQN